MNEMNARSLLDVFVGISSLGFLEWCVHSPRITLCESQDNGNISKLQTRFYPFYMFFSYTSKRRCPYFEKRPSAMSIRGVRRSVRLLACLGSVHFPCSNIYNCWVGVARLLIKVSLLSCLSCRIPLPYSNQSLWNSWRVNHQREFLLYEIKLFY
jgi:hypothetical protein